MNKIFDKANFDLEDFLDEIILVQFKTGIYFTIKGGGAAILRAFEKSISSEDLDKIILEKFGAEKLKEVGSFIEQLTKAGILIDTDTVAAKPEFTNEMFAEPIVFQKFDDMSDLIKLDPIHDVSDLGWPHKK